MPSKVLIKCDDTCEMDDFIENKNMCCFQCKNKSDCANPCEKEECFEKEKEKLEEESFVYDIKIYCIAGIIVTVNNCDKKSAEGFKNWLHTADLKGIFSVTTENGVKLILKQNIIAADVTKH